MNAAVDTKADTTRKPARRGMMPKGLYTRSLLIVILPILLLQAIIVWIFMERHWERTTRVLSAAVAREISNVVSLYEAYPNESDRRQILTISEDNLQFSIDVLPGSELPEPLPAPMFAIIDRNLSEALSDRLVQPFWIDSRSDRRTIEVRVKLANEILSIRTGTSRAYASNSHIFLMWMTIASALLLTVAVLFLRNQIKPILQLADAAENLGMGRDVEDFKPRGAEEVRRASQAFFAMRDRIARQIEQRTTMLAGVSHDLRTVLTRLRLEIALLPPGTETRDLSSDVDEMERMLAGYLAFAKGDGGETARRFDVSALLDEIGSDAERSGNKISVRFSGASDILARPDALKRAIGNLVTNAARFGKTIVLEGTHSDGHIVITVDDDGPGIADEHMEDVFRPFLRLDEARNLDHPGSGLGLTIARDIARGHGGDVTLSKSPMGGLRARLHIPA